MDYFSLLIQGFAVSLQPEYLLACALGVVLGTLVGVLPGIGATSTIALLLPFSFDLDITSSLIMFSGIYYGAMYGGSTTSVLLNVPGEGASVVTCLDGYQMAKRGRAGAALAVSAIGSFVAGTIGVIGLTFFAPLLASVALKFGPPEYFALAFLGIIILVNLTGQSAIKSLLMVLVGVLLGTVGMDSLTGINRFTFGIDELQRGTEFTVVAMGVFGLAEIFTVLAKPANRQQVLSVRFRELYPSREELRRAILPIFRGSGLGFLIGLIPGPATTISTFVAYALEKRRSRHPEEFGKGAIEGVAGPESANNAAVSATMIPLLSLGLPFCSATAILLSGFMIHGVIPGPTLISSRPELFWGLIASMYIGNILLLVINLPLVGIFATLLKTPANILMPIVALIMLTGAYSINNSVFDLVLIIAFGVLGFFMKRGGFEPAPLAIGLILGPTIERGLVQGLIIGGGDVVSLVSRPISGVMLGLALLLILFRSVRWLRGIKRGDAKNGDATGPE